MIELSNTNAQTLSAGQSVIFDVTLLHTGCAEFHRPNSAPTRLTQKNAIYEISYNGNIGATTAEEEGQISLAINGSPLLETTAKVVTAAAGDLQNVSAQTFISTWCGNTNVIITLTNTGTNEINFDINGRISIKRIA